MQPFETPEGGATQGNQQGDIQNDAASGVFTHVSHIDVMKELVGFWSMIPMDQPLFWRNYPETA